MDKIESLADLRPGDIGLMRMGGFIPGLFPVRIGMAICKESYSIGPFSADHALICVEAGRPTGDDLRTIARGNLGLTGAEILDLVRPPRAVQAMPRGAEEIALTPAKHWTDGVMWVRIAEDYPGQAEDAAAIARLFVTEKVPYSFLSYVALAAWSRGLKAEGLERWIDRRRQAVGFQGSSDGYGDDDGRVQLPEEAICSVLVDQAWSLAGKRLMEGVKRQCVTPGALAMRLDRIRVARGGPGFL